MFKLKKEWIDLFWQAVDQGIPPARAIVLLTPTDLDDIIVNRIVVVLEVLRENQDHIIAFLEWFNWFGKMAANPAVKAPAEPEFPPELSRIRDEAYTWRTVASSAI